MSQPSKTRDSALDACVTRHDDHAWSQRKRKAIEGDFGWLELVAGLRRPRHRDTALVDWLVTFASAAYRPHVHATTALQVRSGLAGCQPAGPPLAGAREHADIDARATITLRSAPPLRGPAARTIPSPVTPGFFASLAPARNDCGLDR